MIKKDKNMEVKNHINLGFSDEKQLQQEIQRNQLQNIRMGNAEVRLIGDKVTLIQVIKLLAFVRHAVNDHQHVKFTVDIGSNIADGQFMFDVNGLQVPDYITQEVISIN